MAGFIGRFFERRRMEREGQLGTRKRRTDSIWGEAADRSPILTSFLVLVLWAVCVSVLTLPDLREYPELVPNQLAPSTVFARIGFAYEDKAATAARRSEATKMQPRYFILSDAHNEQVQRRLSELFHAVQQRMQTEKGGQVYSSSGGEMAPRVAALSPAAFLLLVPLEKDNLVREQFAGEVSVLLMDGMIDLTKLTDPTPGSQVRIVDSLGRDRRMRSLRTVTTFQQAANQLTELLLSYTPGGKVEQLDQTALRELMLQLLGHSGNLTLDSKRTIARREAAIAAVPPVMVDVQKNDVIVKRNSLVTQKELDALDAQRKVLTERNQEADRLQNFLHNAFWSLTLILFAGFYLAHIHPEIARSSRSIGMIVTVCALSLGINYLAMETFYFFSGVLAIPPELVPDALPLALPAVLLTVMAGYRVSLYIGFFVAMISALMLGGSFNVALEGFVLSALCGLIVRPSRNYRTFFMRSFLCVVITVWLLDFNMLWYITSAPGILIFSFGLALGNALFTAVAAMLLTFLFELLFNVSTNMSLMVLCDYNHPLLKELHLRAPGTSQHSQNVAVLAENAAIDIEANAVLARAGALFHDIGKIKNPEYFIENNQSGSNPHDRISPRMSSMIISSHVKDGLDLALQYKICRSVRQFIQQHHGTDLIKFFYHQALQEQEGVLESDYRYPGPLAHGREVVIVSLADACEAACRSLEKPTASKIQTMVNDIFRTRWREGQLDNADLTVEELSAINESFVRTLTTMYHSRIAYPKDENNDEDNILVSEQPPAGAEPKTAASGNE